MVAKEHLRERVRGAPDAPGVYIIRDADGRIIYAGKAKSLRKRLASHFTGKTPPRTKAALIRAKAGDVDYVRLKSESEALILEERIIKEYRPRYNISLKDDKRYPLLKITRAEEFPRLVITRARRADGASYFGPYTDAGALRDTIKLIERIFKIRTCRTPSPSEKDVLHCLDYNLGYCLAPCIGRVTPDEYREVVGEVELLLRGRSDRLMRILRKKMKSASEGLRFERAAGLRDMLHSLEKILSHGRGLRTLLSSRSAGRAGGGRGLAGALDLDGEVRSLEAVDISNIMGRDAVGSVVRFHDGRPQRKRYRRFRIKDVAGADDCAMIAEVVRRRYGRLLREAGDLPDLVLIDGGRGQVGAARRAMDTLGLTSLSVAGLAKRNEELHILEKPGPIILKRGTPALSLVQRIRDEAHRFAIDYHRTLRRKRMSHSILDEVTGIGPKSRKKLLEAFGSIGKIRRASVELLKEKAGIDRRTAERLLAYLNAGRV
ncbi:MAG: excinuclease ABC subunit UvrC [Candidatus Tritonobacter lacicola]|nr:excinuclease ABC subunit UvrC [Candidatus Tritonobacter lacicola]